MLARYARLLQLLELAILVAVGIARGPLLAAAIALGWRLALVSLSMALGWWFRSPRASLEGAGALAAWRAWALEYVAFVRFNLVDLPWEHLVLRPDPEPRPTDAPVVVLAHGYFANRGYFRPLVRRLEAAGAVVFAPNVRSWNASIERYAEELHAEIERIARATGRRVILVAHSMGGLGARACLARHGSDRIARLVTIASPHHGTALAPLGSGENARQMRRGSAFLAALERSEAASPPAIPALALYSPHDNMVMPQETSRLPWARNVALPGFGHIALIGCEPLWAALREELRG